MHYKKSEDIARNAHLFECDIDDVTILDEYLARRDRNCFSLFDAKSKTGLGDCTEPLLNDFVQDGILREPKARHLCPVHDISLEIVNDNEGRCIDCDDTHLLDDCETEMLYERISTPETWSNSESVTSSVSSHKSETPFWKDKKWIAERIGIPIILIVAGVIIRGALASPPATTDPIELPTRTVLVEVSSAPANTATPTVDIAPTDTPAYDLTPTS